MSKGGRPKIEITDKQWEQVINMIRIHCTREEVCRLLGGIDEKTLNRIVRDRGEDSFSLLYEKHQSEGKASLRRAQWKLAVDELNPTMLIWLGKNVLGQMDKQELTGSLTVTLEDDSAKL